VSFRKKPPKGGFFYGRLLNTFSLLPECTAGI